MANIFDTVPSAADGEEQGFQIRDLIRFFAVDLIVVILTKLLLALGFFANPSTYVLALLAGKVALFLYLLWLIRDRRGAWRETGAVTPGRWWAWPASLVLYASAYPLLVWLHRFNHVLLTYLYSLAGWTYEPAVQDVVVLIFENILDTPTRLSLVFFAVVAGPFMEELAFRGMGLDAFRRTFGLGWAIFWTSLLFGLYHFSLTFLLPLSFLGAVFAAARVMSTSLWTAVAVHSLHNAVSLAVFAYELGLLRLPDGM